MPSEFQWAPSFAQRVCLEIIRRGRLSCVCGRLWRLANVLRWTRIAVLGLLYAFFPLELIEPSYERLGLSGSSRGIVRLQEVF
jgi:hypothetical protein